MKNLPPLSVSACSYKKTKIHHIIGGYLNHKTNTLSITKLVELYTAANLRLSRVIINLIVLHRLSKSELVFLKV